MVSRMMQDDDDPILLIPVSSNDPHGCDVVVDAVTHDGG